MVIMGGMSSKPHLLFVAHRVPFPPNKGEKIRAYQWLLALKPHYNVHLVTPYDDVADALTLPQLQPYVASMHVVYLSPTRKILNMVRGLCTGQPLSVACFTHASLKQAVQQVRQTYPIVAEVVYTLGALAFTPQDNTPRLLDVVDVDSLKFATYAAHEKSRLKRWLFTRESRLMRALELHTTTHSTLACATSLAEAALLQNICPNVPHIIALPHGVPLPETPPSPSSSTPNIVFVGSMEYPPNIEAALWWHNNVLPLLPLHVVTTIVGRNPPLAVQNLNSPRFVVTGEVDDVAPYLAQASVVVAPLQTARGIQNKVLEGLAALKPVICSPLAAEGLEPVHAGLLMATTPDQYVTALHWVWKNEAAATAMARRGYALACQHFSVQATGEAFAQQVQAVVLKTQPVKQLA